MKKSAQSLMEFAIILMVVTVIAIVSLRIIGDKINSSTNSYDVDENINMDANISQEEANCTKMGLSWDKNNGICEAK